MSKKNEKQVNCLQMVEIDHSKFAVEVINGNVRVNLTQMAKQFRKRPADWLRTEESESYLSKLASVKKCVLTDLVSVRNGGKNPGTWAFDFRVAMRFAQWLDPYFAIMVDDLLVKLLTGEKVVAEPFNGVWPTLINGKPMYNHCAILKSFSMSTRSGSVSRRKKIYPKKFYKFMHQNYITIDLCEKIRKHSKERQLEFSFEQKEIGEKIEKKGGKK